MRKYKLTLIALFLILKIYSQSVDCNYIQPGHIKFLLHSSKLNSVSMNRLHALALQMKSASRCYVVVMGAGNNASCAEAQLGWDQVNCCINFLVDKEQIDRDRFIFLYGNKQDYNLVEFRAATKEEEISAEKSLQSNH